MSVTLSSSLDFLTVIATCGLLYYFLYFFKKLADYKEVRHQLSPPVSVVVCAKNEKANLKSYLPLLLEQNYHNYEVVVIIDHSSDGSFDYVETMAKQSDKLKVYSFQEQKLSGGKKEALQFGISKAKHEHVLLTDADCYPGSKRWITHMSSGFTEKNELVLGIGVYDAGNSKLLSKIVQWDSLMIAIQYLSYSLRDKTYMSVGRNVGYTKNLFLKAEGFNSHLNVSSGDDDLFVQDAESKTLTSIIVTPESHTHSPASRSWKAFFKQKSRHFTTAKKYKPSILFILGFYQFCILVFYTTLIAGFFINEDPILLLTMFFVKNFVQAAIFKRIFFKIGVRVQLIPFLFFDIIWVLLLTIINVKRILSPRTAW